MQSNPKKLDAFRLALVGRSNTGKTYNGTRFLLQLIKRGEFEPKRIIIMSQTYKSDPSIKELLDYCKSHYELFEEHNCFEKINTELINKVFINNKSIKEKKPTKMKPWCFFLDDQVSSELLKWTSRDPTLVQAFCLGRHYGISMIISTQKFIGSIPPILRSQCTMISLQVMGNKSELLDILKDYNELPGLDIKKQIGFLFECYTDAVAKHDNHGQFVIHCYEPFGKKYESCLGTGHFYDHLYSE